MYQALAELLFPHITKTPADYEKMYPQRALKEKAMVTRFAPSPTGFVHMGSLYVAFIAAKMAQQTDGVFYLRIEDTDQKREVEDGIKGIIHDLKAFDYKIDEGPEQLGAYGPYIQTQRVEIYQTYVKDLVARGLAYPCFCESEKLDEIRKGQELNKERLGYYSRYALCRNLSFEQIKDNLEKQIPYVIRLKSPGDFKKTITFHDCIKGNVTFPENDMDIVLLKRDGIPTYHLAHIVDDHLMHTTHVIRGDEWLSSVPVHLQLANVLGFKPCKYAHVAPLTKKEGTTVRKLSKRKDPEASIRYYQEAGIPSAAVKLYLATIANYNFEMWYNQNKGASLDDFKMEFSKMPIGGTLFDMEKLESIARIYFSQKKAVAIYEEAVAYFEVYDSSFASLMKEHKEETIAFLNIEREVARPRKDIASYKDLQSEFAYCYDELFFQEARNPYQELAEDKNYNMALLKEYGEIYQEESSKEEWMEQIKSLAEKYHYAREVKLYKEDPNAYQGHVGDVCEMIRFAVTGRTKTPDLYEILKVLKKERIQKRIEAFVIYKSN